MRVEAFLALPFLLVSCTRGRRQNGDRQMQMTRQVISRQGSWHLAARERGGHRFTAEADPRRVAGADQSPGGVWSRFLRCLLRSGRVPFAFVSCGVPSCPLSLQHYRLARRYEMKSPGTWTLSQSSRLLRMYLTGRCRPDLLRSGTLDKLVQSITQAAAGSRSDGHPESAEGQQLSGLTLRGSDQERTLSLIPSSSPGSVQKAETPARMRAFSPSFWVCLCQEAAVCAVERYARSQRSISREPVEGDSSRLGEREAAGENDSSSEGVVNPHERSRVPPAVSREGKLAQGLNSSSASAQQDAGVWLDTCDLLTAARRIVQKQ